MKERIEKLSRGIVAWGRPGLQISQTNITMTIEEGEAGHGNFLLESTSEQPVRGIIYASSGRVDIVKNQFDCASFLVEYTFDGKGMEPGDMEKNRFYIVSDGGEYEIPMTVFVKKAEGQAVQGRIRYIADLVQTARKNSKEAFRLFGSGAFAAVLRREQPAYETLYRGLRSKGLTQWDMEEFLIAIGEKKKIDLSISAVSKEFFELSVSKRVTIQLEKSTWGYMPVNIETDADFIELEKSGMNTCEFIGNVQDFTYVVNKNKVHDGNNFGRIHITTPYQELIHEVVIHAPLDRDVSFEGRKELKLCEVELLKAYIDFRMKRMNKTAWTKRSLLLLEKLRRLDEENDAYPLFQVQMYLADGRREEAKWILDKFAKKRWGKGRKLELYAYYLYLSTIYRKDPAYTKRVRDEVKRLYMKEKKWQYVWLLLYLDQNLIDHPQKRLDMIHKQFERRQGSLILYLEACLIMSKDSMKLMRLDDFTVYILAAGMKRGAVSKELALRAAELSRQQKQYSYLVYHILEQSWQMFGDTGILAAVCSILIKGNKTEQKYFHWYKKGIESGIKITRIFEYYIYAMDEMHYQELPKNLLMYFAYQTNLEERKRALLYANVIQYAESYPAIYSDFRRQIERFMISQLRKRNINRDLAVIYKTFLTPGIIDDELADALADILFTYEVSMPQTSIKNVVVVHRDMEDVQNVSCTGGTAYVQIYSEHHQMFFQDTRGVRYITTIPCEKKRLLDTVLYEQLCTEYECIHTGYLLHKWNRRPLQEENIQLYVELYRDENISLAAKQYIQKEVLMSYQMMQDQDWVGELLPGLDFEVLSAQERKAMMDVLLDQGLFERAYALYKSFGNCRIPAGRMVKMAARMIRQKEYGEEKELLDLAGILFSEAAYDKTILEYMGMYYNRDSRSMTKLWEASGEFDLDTHKLEERLIPQILFTGIYLGSTKDMYASYYRSHPNRRIRMAYLVDQSHRYFVNRSVPDPDLFEYLEKEYHRERRLPQPCKLALLEQYAGKTPEDGPRRRMLYSFMEELVYQGKCFACFLKYDREMTRSFFLTEKVVIEHRAAPTAKVVLHYRIAGEEKKRSYIGEAMKQACEGVYVKSISLFYGEVLEYYITERDEHGEKRTEEKEMRNAAAAEPDNSRFGYLNQMYKAEQEGEQELLKKLAAEYAELDRRTETIFSIR